MTDLHHRAALALADHYGSVEAASARLIQLREEAQRISVEVRENIKRRKKTPLGP